MMRPHPKPGHRCTAIAKHFKPAFPLQLGYALRISLIGALLLASSACDQLGWLSKHTSHLEPQLATVNGHPISLHTYMDQYQLLMLNWGYQIVLSAEEKAQVKAALLDSLIDIALLEQEVVRKGLALETDTLKAKPWENPLLQDQLEKSVLGINWMREAWQRKFKRNTLLHKLALQEVWSKIEISEEETRAYYALNKAAFSQKKQIKVRHLCVESKQRLKYIQKRLRSGEDFVHLIRNFSITPDRQQDGDLGYVEPGVLPAAFDKVIFQIKTINDYSSFKQPVHTSMGYHLFRLEGRREARVLSYTLAKPLIRNILRDQKQAVAFQEWLDTLRAQASIQIDKNLLYDI